MTRHAALGRRNLSVARTQSSVRIDPICVFGYSLFFSTLFRNMTRRSNRSATVRMLAITAQTNIHAFGFVMTAQAGIHALHPSNARDRAWGPACAGVTKSVDTVLKIKPKSEIFETRPT
jgi:hypothetical protein